MPAESAVQKLVDELAIRNLLAELTHLMDTGSEEDLERYIALFTEDATWTVIPPGGGPPRERKGREDILANVRHLRSAGIQGPDSGTKHALDTIVVSFTAPDTAVVRCNWQYFKECSSKAPVLASVGQYLSTFARTPDGWKLARRELTTG